MDLLSVFKGGAAASAPADPAPSLDSVAVARKRARQRLIGATVLVVIAVVGFPMVFNSAPRPISVDVPIDIPHKDGAAPLNMPAKAAGVDGAATGIAAAASAIAAATSPGGAVIAEGKDDAGTDVKGPVPDARASVGPPGPPHVAKPAAKAVAKAATPAPKPVAKSESTVATASPTLTQTPAPTPVTPRSEEAARARDLLDNRPLAKADVASAKPAPKPAAPAAATTPATITPSSETRFAIQVAAFSSEPSALEMRSKLDKAGVKSYTQVIDTPQGKRIRVRVGPFASRDEAERAAGKIKSAGLPSSIVPL